MGLPRAADNARTGDTPSAPVDAAKQNPWTMTSKAILLAQSFAWSCLGLRHDNRLETAGAKSPTELGELRSDERHVHTLHQRKLRFEYQVRGSGLGRRLAIRRLHLGREI